MNELYRIGQIGIGVSVFRFHAVIQEVWSIEATVTRDRGSRAGYSQNGLDHRDELALSICVAVDVPLGCLDRSMPCQQLNIPHGPACMMDEPSRAGDEGPAARMG